MRTAIWIFVAFVAGFLVRNWIGHVLPGVRIVNKTDNDTKK